MTRSPQVRRRFPAAVPLAAAAAAGALWAATPAPAANYSWDPARSAADPGSGGTGNWDTTSTFWHLAGSTADSTWPNTLNDTATFAAAAGTVTVVTPLNCQGLIFNTSGYTIAGGTANNFFLGSLGINTTALAGGTTNVNQLLTLAANQTWNLGGTANVLNLGTGVTTANNSPLTIAGGTTNYAGATFTPQKFTLTGGAVFNSTGTASIPAAGTYTGIGDGNANATLNVTGGTFATAATLFVGNGNLSTVSVSGGGTLSTISTINLGHGFNNNGVGTGVLTITGGTVNTGGATGNIRVGNLGTGNGTVNLNAGGVLATNAAIAPGSATTTAAGTTRGNVFNFNGGTLQSLGNNLTVANTIQSNVLAGGAVIDTQAFNNSRATNLSTGTPADGG